MQIQNKEEYKLKEELLRESQYLSSLVKAYYTNPKNRWKIEQLSQQKYLYVGGKLEQIKDDNDFKHGCYGIDNRQFIVDPEIEEIEYTIRRMRVLKIKLQSIETFERLKNQDLESFDFNKVIIPDRFWWEDNEY